MSGSVVAVIQLALITLAVSVALRLRDRGLKSRFAALEQSTAAAEVLMDQTARRLESVAPAPVDHPAGETPDSVALAFHQAHWQKLRGESHRTALRLLEHQPACHAAIRELYASFNAMDRALDVTAPALPELPLDHVATQGAAELDASQEAENLRAANELLRQRLARVQTQLQRHAASSSPSETVERPAPPKASRDGRDMLSRIQDLVRNPSDVAA